MNLEREYWYKRFPISDKCQYCDTPIDRSNSQRVMRVLENDRYMLVDICLSCLPRLRANVLSKKGGASVIDHNTKTITSSNPNHIKQIFNK